ncbi:MAG TPA: glycosyltransferase [Defluviitaleaceae bacterium]|jgi:glycosyltransferase involved in cell wall biosynthesis|nr:glycosyltransferase [Defluviitaleaceae bacterium]
MKLLICIPNLDIAGAEVMCTNLAIQLKQKHEVVVVSLYNKKTRLTDYLERSGIKLLYLNKKGGFDFSIVKNLKVIIENEKPDVIHTHLYAFKYVYFANKRIKTPIIHTVHNIAQKEATRLDVLIQKIAFKKNSIVPVALSPEIACSISKLYKIQKNKIPIIYNGIEILNYKPKQSYEFSDCIRIINVARFFPQKNHESLIFGFYEALKKRSNLILDLVGDGPLYNRCCQIVKELNIGDKVNFWGVRDDVPRLLYNSDIFILPSLYEGMPMTVAEAMCVGMPILCTNVGGISSMVINGYSALYIENDPNNICNSILHICENDFFREKIGKNALSDSLKFSSSSMAENYSELYKKVVKLGAARNGKE